jgi:hypothetical protein
MDAHPRGLAGLRCAVALGLALALASPASAPSPYLDRGHGRTVLLEVLKPAFDVEDGPDLPTTTSLLCGRLLVASQTRVVLELPSAIYEEEDFSDTVNLAYGISLGLVF